MSDNITSHNQSGGITSKTVSINSTSTPTPQSSPEPKKPATSKLVWAVVSSAIILLAAVAAILQYLEIKLW